MKRINYEEITGLHLELTTKCNAACPMCNRNFKGKVRNKLKMTELSLDDCKKILNVEFLKQLKLISMCGVFGDPINDKDLLEILDYIYSINSNIVINIYTNGSLYDIDWWKDLAKRLKNGRVIFGIDGLDGISELHRCKTNFKKVIENAKAFIDAGGLAQWDYIVFKHNEHQVEEARKLSKKLGFFEFQIKKTSRFFKTLYENDEFLDSTILDYGKHPVYDAKGNIKYYIEMPDNKEYRNNTEDEIFEKINSNKTFNKYLDSVHIECQTVKTKGIFISAFGEVFPCCTVYQQVCYGSIFGVNDSQELNEYNIYKKYDLSAFNHSIKEIVMGTFFENIQDSFSKKSILEGKCKSCSRACGKNLDIHGATHTKEV